MFPPLDREKAKTKIQHDNPKPTSLHREKHKNKKKQQQQQKAKPKTEKERKWLLPPLPLSESLSELSPLKGHLQKLNPLSQKAESGANSLGIKPLFHRQAPPPAEKWQGSGRGRRALKAPHYKCSMVNTQRTPPLHPAVAGTGGVGSRLWALAGCPWLLSLTLFWWT